MPALSEEITVTMAGCALSVDQVEKLIGIDLFGSFPAGERNRLERAVIELPAQ